MPKESAKKSKDTTVTPHPQVVFKHADDFRSGYANNVRFESTVYDLKILFGESDQTTGSEVVQQHTAMTIPWAMVKLAIYFLKVNLEIHEMVNGKVAVPPSQIPPPANPVPPEMSNDPNAHKAKEIVTKLREEFIANL